MQYLADLYRLLSKAWRFPKRESRRRHSAWPLWLERLEERRVLNAAGLSAGHRVDEAVSVSDEASHLLLLSHAEVDSINDVQQYDGTFTSDVPEFPAASSVYEVKVVDSTAGTPVDSTTDPRTFEVPIGDPMTGGGARAGLFEWHVTDNNDNAIPPGEIGSLPFTVTAADNEPALITVTVADNEPALITVTVADNEPALITVLVTVSENDNGELPVDFSVSGFTNYGIATFDQPQGYLGNIHYLRGSAPAGTAPWTFTGLPDGFYQASATWFAQGNRADDSPYIFNIRTVDDTPDAQQTLSQQLTFYNSNHAGVGREWISGDMHVTVTVTDDAAGNFVRNSSPAFPSFAVTVTLDHAASNPAKYVNGGTAVSSNIGDRRLQNRQGFQDSMVYVKRRESLLANNRNASTTDFTNSQLVTATRDGTNLHLRFANDRHCQAMISVRVTDPVEPAAELIFILSSLPAASGTLPQAAGDVAIVAGNPPLMLDAPQPTRSAGRARAIVTGNPPLMLDDRSSPPRPMKSRSRPSNSSFRSSGVPNGGDHESQEATIAITITPVNDQPFLVPIANKSVDKHARFNFEVSASDPDLPANSVADDSRMGNRQGFQDRAFDVESLESFFEDDRNSSTTSFIHGGEDVDFDLLFITGNTNELTLNVDQYFSELGEDARNTSESTRNERAGAAGIVILLWFASQSETTPIGQEILARLRRKYQLCFVLSVTIKGIPKQAVLRKASGERISGCTEVTLTVDELEGLTATMSAEAGCEAVLEIAVAVKPSIERVISLAATVAELEKELSKSDDELVADILNSSSKPLRQSQRKRIQGRARRVQNEEMLRQVVTTMNAVNALTKLAALDDKELRNEIYAAPPKALENRQIERIRAAVGSEM